MRHTVATELRKSKSEGFLLGGDGGSTRTLVAVSSFLQICSGHARHCWVLLGLLGTVESLNCWVLLGIVGACYAL